MEDVKVVTVNVQPVGSTEIPPIEESIQATANVMNDVLNEFEDCDSKESKASKFLKDFRSYIQGADFKNDVNEVAKKYGVPPKKVAQNFFEKALGTVGDILGIAISVVCNAGHMVINLASTVAHGIVNLIKSIAEGIASIVTFNRTCVA